VSDAKGKTRLQFRISFPDGSVRDETFEQDSVKIGTSPTCHLKLEHDSVSRLHAVIEVSAPGQVQVVDLSSKAGTFVNEQKVAPRAKLLSGSQLRIGEVRIDVLIGAAGEAVSAALPAPTPAAAPAAPAAAAPKAAAPPAKNPFAPTTGGLPVPGGAKKRSQAKNPFASRGGLPNPLAKGAEGAQGLVASGPPVDPREVETDERSIEVVVMWGENQVIHVSHLEPGKQFTVGGGEVESETKDADVDFIVGTEALGMDSLPVVVHEAGRAWVVIPKDATGEQIKGGQKTPLSSLPLQSSAAVPGAQQIALEPDTTIRVKHREFIFVVKDVNAGKKVAGAFKMDWGFFAYIGGAALFFLIFVLAVYLMPPTGGALSGQALDVNNRLIQFAIDVAEQEDEEPEPSTSGDPGTAAADDEGAMGEPEEKKTDKRFGVQGTASETQLARNEMKEMAASTAVAGILASLSGSFNAPTSPYGGDTAIGGDPMNAIGNMMGSSVGSSGGFGGLGVSGTGSGGGGFGLGTIGVGNMGTVGGGGVGRPGGKLTRTGVVPKMSAGTPVTKGSLDKEIIRRVVRRNESQVRFCYEQGLHANPDLKGRVEIKFLIAPTGAVQNSAVAKTEVGNQVGQCIANAVRRWTFPAPEGGGIVSVTYPWTFSAGN
jgi:TonB family protein